MGITRIGRHLACRAQQADSRNGQGEDRSGYADQRPGKGEQEDRKGDHSTGQHANQGGRGGHQGRHHDGAVAAFLRGVQAALGNHTAASLHPPGRGALCHPRRYRHMEAQPARPYRMGLDEP